MARLNVVMCDLCKKISKTDEPGLLKATRGRGESKQVINAEVCDSCFYDLQTKIDKIVTLDAIGATPNYGPPPGVLRTPIAKRGPVESSMCKHIRTEFKSPFVHCLDCGNQEKI